MKIPRYIRLKISAKSRAHATARAIVFFPPEVVKCVENVAPYFVDMFQFARSPVFLEKASMISQANRNFPYVALHVGLLVIMDYTYTDRSKSSRPRVRKRSQLWFIEKKKGKKGKTRSITFSSFF